jgi:hypothetical protein
VRRFGIGIVAALLLSACEQAAAPTTVQPTRLPVSTPSPTATPVPTPTPAPALALDKVGAAASPSGFMAFAVVSNPSGETAFDVSITISAVSGSGQTLASRAARIPRIAAGQRQAVAVAFPVGRTLPAQFSGSVANVRWSTDSAADVAQVAGASFIQDARTPSVRVHLINQGQGADRVAVVAICWDAGGNIRGGGSRIVLVGPGAQGHDVTIQVSISTQPSSCDAYALTSS